MYSRKI